MLNQNNCVTAVTAITLCREGERGKAKAQPEVATELLLGQLGAIEGAWHGREPGPSNFGVTQLGCLSCHHAEVLQSILFLLLFCLFLATGAWWWWQHGPVPPGPR
jgi:hypothetical protein